MKFRKLWLPLVVLFSTTANAESFKMYRWQENYQSLANKSNLNWYESIKYLPLAKERYVSFGGTVRHRFNDYENDRFGLLGEESGSFSITRTLLHADIHIGDDMRTFIEVGHHHAAGDEELWGPFDEDKLDLTQGFIDINVSETRFRLGRQEMKLGSTRLLGVRNGPNIRLAFDGLRVDTTMSDTKVQAFVLNPVQVQESNFDNRSNDNESFWGLYSTLHGQATNADLYYLGLYRGASEFAQGVDNEKRHTIGTRIFGKKNNWDWNYEIVYQFGDFGRADISAWTVATVTGYTFEKMNWKPRLSISANIASGDDNPNDDELNTFNPLFPNLTYFDDSAVLAPQNFFNIEPRLEFSVSEKLSFVFDWNFFWRLEEEDAVYVRGLNPIEVTKAQDGRAVANTPSLNIDYAFNRHLALEASYSYFNAGSAITAAGGEDIKFFKLEATWTF